MISMKIITQNKGTTSITTSWGTTTSLLTTTDMAITTKGKIINAV